jgi:hypothetical protein
MSSINSGNLPFINFDNLQINSGKPAKETADHFLLNCEPYDLERHELRKKVGVQGMRTSLLLGNHKMVKETVNYIEKTQRFKV